MKPSMTIAMNAPMTIAMNAPMSSVESIRDQIALPAAIATTEEVLVKFSRREAVGA